MLLFRRFWLERCLAAITACQQQPCVAPSRPFIYPYLRGRYCEIRTYKLGFHMPGHKYVFMNFRINVFRHGVNKPDILYEVPFSPGESPSFSNAHENAASSGK